MKSGPGGLPWCALDILWGRSDTKANGFGPGTEVEAAGDAGVSLIEVIVPMTVFAVIAASASLALIQVHSGVRDNERRVQAATLAQTQIEAARAQAATELPDGVVRFTKKVGQIEYRVHQQTEYVASSQSGDQCNATSVTLAYKSVHVTVTWADMGTVRPVESSTSVALRPGEFESKSATGGFVLRVLGADGVGISGVQVSASAGGLPPRIKLTDVQGCVAFADLPAAEAGTEYSVEFAKPGLVGQQAQALPSRVLVVKRNEIAQVAQVAPVQAAELGNGQITINNDRVTSAERTHWYRAANGGQWQQLPDCAVDPKVVCMYGNLTPTIVGVNKTGVVRNLPAGTYEIGTSACAVDPPALSASVAVTSGGNSNVTLPLAGVRFTLLEGDRTPEPGQYIVMRNTACTKRTQDVPGEYIGPANDDKPSGFMLPPGEYEAYYGSKTLTGVDQASQKVTVKVMDPANFLEVKLVAPG